MRLYHAMRETYVNWTRLTKIEDSAFVEFTVKAVGNETDAKAKVLKPFYAVRDDVRYDAYLPLGDVASYSGKGSLAMGGLVCFQGGPAGRVRPLSRHRGAAGIRGCSQPHGDPKID